MKKLQTILLDNVHSEAGSKLAQTIKKKRKNIVYQTTLIVLVKYVQEVLNEFTLGERYQRLQENIFRYRTSRKPQNFIRGAL